MSRPDAGDMYVENLETMSMKDGQVLVAISAHTMSHQYTVTQEKSMTSQREDNFCDSLLAFLYTEQFL